MSSDSEVEDFYDAPDSTPTRAGRLHAGSIVSVDSIETPLADIEEEQKKLLEARTLAEEKRRREDEEIQKKLQKLEDQKKRQHERKLREAEEAQKKAEENERRRRKLEEMRELMADETTPQRTAPPKPARTFISNDSSDTSLDVSVDTSVSDTTPELQRFYSAIDIVQPSSDSLLSDDRDTVSRLAAPPDSTGGSSETLDSSHSSIEVEGNGNLNYNRPDEQTEKLHSKHIPELVIDESEDALESEPDIDSPTHDTSVKPEPDIVQCVRTRKDPPPRPVAPPRRKKKPVPVDTSPEENTLAPQASCSKSVRGLPTELTPTSTVFNMTRELEQSLDMQSATSGTCIVTAKETESSKAERTEEENRDDSEMKPHDALRSSSLPASYRNVPNTSKAVDPTQSKEGAAEKAEPEVPRPRSNSGRFLSDKEILDMVMVRNLDTGESIPLSLAEEKLPQCVNPISLHIMRRTKEYSSNSSLYKGRNSDDEDSKGQSTATTIRAVKARKIKTIRLRRFIGKTVNKIKLGADKVLHGEEAVSDDDDDTLEGRRMIKIKASNHHKGPYDFDLLVPVQDLVGEHMGAVWTMKFSHCGRILATGGQDNLLRVWVLKSAYAFFDDMRQKYSEATKVSPTPSQDSLSSQSSDACAAAQEVLEEDEHAPFMRRPFFVYKSHTGDILDLSWSKNYFILTSSMDKTVRLWHISRKECLCCFQHIDFVTAIAFHPRDDRYFLSGSLDGKLRLWSIPDKKVARWNEVIGSSNLITAANFCVNGKFAVVGTYDGRCVFYSTEQFKYYTQIHVRSTRGKNARGRKVTGIEPMPGEDKIMVTSNDSRIRIYDLRDLTLTSKYKGCANNSSQIKASFNYNGKYIICGSEDQFVYIWRVQHQHQTARKDRNDFWEGIKAHQAVVTAAIFAPCPSQIIRPQFEFMDDEDHDETPDVRGEVLVSADFSGAIKVFINKFKPGSG